MGLTVLTIDDPAASAGAPAAAPAAAPPAAPAPAPTAAPAAAPAPTAAPAPAGSPPAAPAPSPAPAPAGAPETYADFTLPDGVQADAEVLTEFKAFAKEHNLPQEAAQKVIDLQAKVSQKNVEVLKQQLADHWAPVGGTPDKWEAQAKADKEFGGDKFDENLAAAAAARDRFGTPLLKEVLNRTGAGSHPEVLRFFLRVGKAISEDGFVPGRGSGSKSDADVFYAKP